MQLNHVSRLSFRYGKVIRRLFFQWFTGCRNKRVVKQKDDIYLHTRYMIICLRFYDPDNTFTAEKTTAGGKKVAVQYKI